jgi:hypothetical protein
METRVKLSREIPNHLDAKTVPGETLSGMTNPESVGASLEEQQLSRKFRSVFLDPAWLVALLAGAWGVVLALEDFFVADCFAVAIAIVVCLKVAQETNIYRPGGRRWIIFIVACAFVVGTVALDLRWTKRIEKESSERREQLSQLNDIPNLKSQLHDLKQQQTDKANADNVKGGIADQKLDDIEQENKELRKDLSSKDAALISIAKDQYALNFFPQVFVTTGDTLTEIFITNNGKTNVDLYEIDLEGHPQSRKELPSLIISNSRVSFDLDESTKISIPRRAPGGNAERIPVEGVAYIRTLDKKQYSLAFTWYFDIKDGKISKINVLDQPIIEIKPQR